MEKRKQKQVWIFYDGACGLCHRFVHFSVSRIACQTPLYFSPLEGSTFKNLQKDFPKQPFPDSIIVYDENKKRLLVKSEAIIKVLSLLVQPWRSIAFFLRGLPLFILNRIYDFIAKTRHKLFKRPKQSCPTIPKEWKKFFKD